MASRNGPGAWLAGVSIPGLGGEEVQARQLLGRRDRLPVGFFQSDEDLPAMHLNFTWGVDTEANVISPDLEYRHHDVVPDHDALIGVAGENQHQPSLLVRGSAEPSGWGTQALTSLCR